MYSKVGLILYREGKDENRLFKEIKLLANIESGKGKLYKG